MRTTITILTCFCLLWPLVGKAQFAKGDKFVGGSITYSTSGRPNAFLSPTYSNSFSINPTLGFLVGDGFALGARVGLGYSFYEDTDFNLGRYTVETKTYSAGFFLSKYTPLAGDWFWFSITGGLEYGRRVLEAPFTTTLPGGDNYTLSLNVRPGFVLLPNPRWGITLSIGNLFYNHYHGIGNEVTENEVGFSLGPVGVGVLYFFK